MRSLLSATALAGMLGCTLVPSLALADGTTPAAPPATPAPATAAVPAAPAAAAAAAAAPAAITLNGPGMTQPLALPAAPFNVDVGPLGKWYVGGVASGLGFLQSNATPQFTFNNDGSAVNEHANTGEIDLSNAQVFIQKIDGIFQFYAQIGAYSIPALGTGYLPATKATDALFGVAPIVYGKLQLTPTLAVEGGKLATLIGAESTWTFENYTIERGLLWNIEPAVGRGIQGNYTIGPVALAVQLTDGFYSDKLNWITASAVWTINPTNTLALVGGGNVGKTGPTNPAGFTFATPVPQNNGQVYNLIYTYSSGKLNINPYLQYTHVDARPEYAINKSGSTYGGAVLANYAFTDNFSLSARGEYLAGSGHKGDGGPNMTFYGPGSKAWSVTLTPTYKFNKFFVRGEVSYVGLSDIDPGLGFGTSFSRTTQVRGMLETGVIF